MIEFVVPGEPHGKGRPRAFIRNGRIATYTPRATAIYENLVAVSASDAMNGRLPLEGPIAVTIDIAMKVPASWSQKKRDEALAGKSLPAKKPDIDNVVKSIFDGSNGIVWHDDAQVVKLVVVKRYSEIPSVTVNVAEHDGQETNGKFREMEGRCRNHS